MSFAQLTRPVGSNYAERGDRLAQEWAHPQNDSSEPVIIEESEHQQVPSHLYVIWSEWRPLSQCERSKAIVNAYEQVRGRAFALNVSVAMGPTPEEAQRMGIEYAPLDNAA